jgi:CRISPR type I-E-associated protein CasB/Cse2
MQQLTARARASSQSERSRAWWQEYCHPERGDPAARAQLRRCRSTRDAIMIPAALSLVRRLGAGTSSATDERVSRALDLARVLAHVRDDVQERLPMRALGWPRFPGSERVGTEENRPRLSEARFRRLMQAEGGEELVTAFVRLVRLIGEGGVSVERLAEAFLFWGHESDRIRRRWAFDYYNAATAAPPEPTPLEEVDE